VRICLLSSSHRPDDDRIYYKEARSLAKVYEDVWLISPFGEHTPVGDSPVRFRPFIKGRGPIGRLITMKRLFHAGIACRADVYHCHEPESLLVAARLKKALGSKVIFDSHELWESVVSDRFPRPIRGLVRSSYRAIEAGFLRQCDGAIGATWGISEHLADGVSQFTPVETVLNVPVVDVFGEACPREWGETTVLCHDGFLSFDRGLEAMCEAVRLVASRFSVRLKIVGDVFDRERTWLDSFVGKHRLSEVIVRTGWLPYDQVGQALSPCHIGLISFAPGANHAIAAPNKLFNYMLYGMPVVGPAFMSGLRKVVDEERCGLLVDPGSPETYAAAITQMIEQREATLEMGRNALLASREKYRWEHMEPVLFGLYEKVMAAGA